MQVAQRVRSVACRAVLRLCRQQHSSLSTSNGFDQNFLLRENGRVWDFMNDSVELQRSLANEIESFEADLPESPAEVIDGWKYYTRLESGSESRLFCRCPDDTDTISTSNPDNEPPNNEDVLLDLNTIFPTAQYLSLGRIVLSHDHKYLAFTLDSTGEELFDLYIKDLETHQIKLHVENVNCVEWGNTSTPYTLYLT